MQECKGAEVQRWCRSGAGTGVQFMFRGADAGAGAGSEVQRFRGSEVQRCWSRKQEEVLVQEEMQV